MAMCLRHRIGAISGTHFPAASSGDVRSSAKAVAAIWRNPRNGRVLAQKTGAESDRLPSSSLITPVIGGGVRPDISTAAQALMMPSPVTAQAEESQRGVPVYVMMPLDSVTWNHTVNRKKAMNVSLQALRSGGVRGIMVEVWWGLVEGEAAGEYNWGGYSELLEMAKKHGLKVQVVMSFHQCGGNVGDSCTIPLPKWVVEEIDNDPDLVYTDQWGRKNYEYLSLGCDNLLVLRGRTPIQCYSDFMRAFKDHFSHLLGDTIVEIQVGTGPAGELRYPEQNGAFQCYDKYMLSSLKAAAELCGKPEWGNTRPTYAGHWPQDTSFFREEEAGLNREYGEFFLLLDHGDQILQSAMGVFETEAVEISVKVAGIHGHYGARSHPAELTAGYYNTLPRNGYLPVAHHGVEMRDREQPRDALCAPEKLVEQVASASVEANVPLAGGENALPTGRRARCVCTYLRMTAELFQPDNWRRFVAFVKKMSEGEHECRAPLSGYFVKDSRVFGARS